MFSITLQKILPRDLMLDYPCCMSGSGGMLLEDCGGPYCYSLITAWCRNKTTENQEVLLEMFDEEILEAYEDFNPDEFKKDEVNCILSEK